MNDEELKQHLAGPEHGLDVLVEVCGWSMEYLRGVHDGAHGRIDSDDLNLPGHGNAADYAGRL